MAERMDLTQRLGAALGGGEDPSSQDVANLVSRARARAATRRRTRSRVVVGAAAVAMVLAVVPLALLGRADRDRAGAASAAGWRTLELRVPTDGDRDLSLAVDVPRRWDGAGEDDDGVRAFADTGTQDFRFGPGLHAAADYGYPVEAPWSGYVTLGGLGDVEGYVQVATDDRDTALRVLGSVRRQGEPAPDLTGPWAARTVGGASWLAPSDPDVVDVDLGPAWNGPRGGFGDLSRTQTASGPRWSARATLGEVELSARAPTRALAELVAGTARPDPASGSWSSRTVAGVSFDVPTGWVRLDTGACRAAAVRYGPVGTEPCASPAPLTVASARSVLLDGTPGLDSGYVLVGDQVVTADGDPDVVRRVLASAHVPGEDPGDLDGAWEQHSEDGVTWQEPKGADVRVEASTGSTVSCAAGGPQYRASPVTGGEWRAAYCGDGTASVVASTQALADVVASTVEGDASPGPSDTEDWRTVVARDVTFDVPANWVAIGPCRDRVDPVRFGPAGTDVCTQVPPLEVGGIDSPQALSAPGLRQGPSVVFGGRSMVLARGDLQIKRRVLASVRLVDDPVVDVSQWRTKVVGPFVADVPASAAADVDLLQRPGVFDGVSYQPAVERDGVWLATTSPDTYRVVQVTAPTQALADLVASTVRE